MPWCCFTGPEYFLYPGIRDPRSEQIPQAANENVRWFLLLCQHWQAVPVHYRFKSHRVRYNLAYLVFKWVIQDIKSVFILPELAGSFVDPHVSGEALCLFRCVAVWAAMPAAGDRVPGEVTPLDL